MTLRGTDPESFITESILQYTRMRFCTRIFQTDRLRESTSGCYVLGRESALAGIRIRWPGMLLWDGLGMSVRNPGHLSRANGA